MVTSEGVLLQVGKAGTDETLYQNCGGRAHGRRQSRAKREQKISTSEEKKNMVKAVAQGRKRAKISTSQN